MNKKSPYTNVLIKTGHVALLGIAIFGLNPQAIASCDDGEREVANQLVEEARSEVDDIERLVLLKRSVKACPEFVMWLELGKVQLALENSSDAVIAFESARDFHSPQGDGSFSVSTIRRQTVSNGWLAEAYQRNKDLASASVAAQEARNGFEALGRSMPERLVRLQANIDDAMVNADASILARSFEIQHERATRGIGVRPIVSPELEPSELALESEQLENDYINGGSTQLAASADVGSSIEEAVATAPDNNESDVQKPMTESRLNIPVLFAYDSAELSEVSRRTVRQLGGAIDAMKLVQPATVIVVGHTDAQGSAAYNQSLSLRRATAVLDAIKALVSSDPVYQSSGRGEEELRYSGNSADDHRRNRRVEIIIKR